MLGKRDKLRGTTVFVVDTSGSMGSKISGKSNFSRLDVAAAMAAMAAEQCERVILFRTAGDDYSRVHKTQELPPRRGFALMDEIIHNSQRVVGGGGIFTRQCLDWIRERVREPVERILVFSDSQDCDLPERRIPNPFGRYNYVIDVSAHQNGVNYKGVWTAEIAGWSEHFLDYVLAYEEWAQEWGNTC